MQAAVGLALLLALSELLVEGANMAEKVTPETIYQHPRGWWFKYETFKTAWCGPFKTAEEATAVARKLITSHRQVIELIEVQLWEQREVSLR